jgi:hypothetical protein
VSHRFIQSEIFFFIFSPRYAYPPYGFYILNRVGMDDYISRLYPEDELFDQNNILIIRSFPDFLARRLAGIDASTSETPDKFSDIYAIPNIQDLGTKQKGRFFNIGLWMQPTDSRESMLKVMKRYVIRSFQAHTMFNFLQPSFICQAKPTIPSRVPIWSRKASSSPQAACCSKNSRSGAVQAI